MKYLEIRSFMFDGDDSCGGIGKHIVTVGLRDDGKMFFLSTTLRADYLANKPEAAESYKKFKQDNDQQFWDSFKWGKSPAVSVSRDEYEIEFKRQMGLYGDAVEIPAWVQ